MTYAREQPRDKQSVTVHEKSRKAEPFNVHWKRAMKLIFIVTSYNDITKNFFFNYLFNYSDHGCYVIRKHF